MDWSLGAESLPRIVSVLKFLVLGMACMAVLMAVRAARRQDAPATGSKAARRLSPLFLMAFLSIAGYQATWQLTGFMRPEFVAFMRRYNRRPTARTAGSRGRILDRRGMVLATDGDTPGRRAYPQGRATCHVVGYSDPRCNKKPVKQKYDGLNNCFAFLDKLLFTHKWENISQTHEICNYQHQENYKQCADNTTTCRHFLHLLI